MKTYVRKTTNAIRMTVVHLTTPEKSSGFFSFSIFWLIFLGLSFAGCSYQVYDRINHYLSEPVVVDVSNSVATKDDGFKVTICYFFNGIHDDYINRNVKITMEDIWRKVNISKEIEEAYLSKSGKKYRNATLKNVDIEKGPCIEVHYDDMSPTIGDIVTVNYAFKRPDTAMYLIGKGDAKILWQYLGMYAYEINNKIQDEIIISLEKYHFLNRKNKKCLELEDYEACLMKCYDDFLHSRLKNCQLPFENSPKRANLTKCLLTREMTDIIEVLSRSRDGESSPNTRVCPRSCTRRQYESMVDFAANGKMEIKLQSNVVRKIEERRAYSGVSLLCDVGGNLSLFFGICCLTVVEIAMFFMQWLGFKKRSRVFTKSKLFQRVSQVFQEEKLRKSTLPQSEKSHRGYARLFYVIFGLICFLQICERIIFYFDHTTHVVIELVPHGLNVFYLVSCLGSSEILKKIDEFSNRFNISTDKVDIVDLLDYSAEFADANDLWRASADLKRYQSGVGNKPAPFITPFGNCSLLSSRWLDVDIERRNCMFKQYFDSVDHRSITYKKYELFQCQSYTEMNSIVQTVPDSMKIHIKEIKYSEVLRLQIVRINTPRQPCMTAIEADDCEQRCYRSIFLRSNITCTLPFIKFLDLPTCTTTKSAKYTKNAYLNAFVQTDPLKECSCHLRCTETLLHSTRSRTFVYPTQTFVSYGYGNHLKEVISQKLSFPIEKLICDIGSNLGSIVGISALSLFKLFEHAGSSQTVQKLRLNFKR